MFAMNIFGFYKNERVASVKAFDRKDSVCTMHNAQSTPNGLIHNKFIVNKMIIIFARSGHRPCAFVHNAWTSL